MPKFEAKRGDFAKIWQTLGGGGGGGGGGYTSPGSAAHEISVVKCMIHNHHLTLASAEE